MKLHLGRLKDNEQELTRLTIKYWIVYPSHKEFPVPDAASDRQLSMFEDIVVKGLLVVGITGVGLAFV